MPRIKGKSVTITVGYYVLRFQEGVPFRESSPKKFTVKEGERKVIPCPHCGKDIEVVVGLGSSR